MPQTGEARLPVANKQWLQLSFLTKVMFSTNAICNNLSMYLRQAPVKHSFVCKQFSLKRNIEELESDNAIGIRNACF